MINSESCIRLANVRSIEEIRNDGTRAYVSLDRDYDVTRAQTRTCKATLDVWSHTTIFVERTPSASKVAAADQRNTLRIVFTGLDDAIGYWSQSIDNRGDALNSPPLFEMRRDNFALRH
ncbi:MAG: hypothetical protein TEF_03135 [Rhizobiales bacterium NRL2]|nr:MAG: hypothetical protein TEF_03135 [Rhizobiales bacterium NRL2]